LAAGYSSIAWSSKDFNKEDKEAFVCSLTNEMRVFRPNNPSKAVYHSSLWGPCFDNALAVDHTMNEKNKGWCRVKDSTGDIAKYCVETDTQGNNVLTGDKGKFTCTGLEVFLIE
jgi:hypothetical protein